MVVPLLGALKKTILLLTGRIKLLSAIEHADKEHLRGTKSSGWETSRCRNGSCVLGGGRRGEREREEGGELGPFDDVFESNGDSEDAAKKLGD